MEGEKRDGDKRGGEKRTTYRVQTAQYKPDLTTRVSGNGGEAIVNCWIQVLTEVQHTLDDISVQPKALTYNQN